MSRQGNVANLFWAVLLCLPSYCSAQQLNNPSFEGITGIARTPEGWSPLGKASSPDTQPGAWNVRALASEGNTYLSLVCRGKSILNSYLWEACYQELDNPLLAGRSYKYSIDLACSYSFYASPVPFNNPVNLRVWGVNKNQESKELLWESGPVTKAAWETYKFTARPNSMLNYFVLEAYYVALPKYCGNILVDNIVYYPEEEIQNDTNLFADNPFGNDTVDTPLIDPGLPDKINGREVVERTTVKLKTDYLVIKIWDHRTFDGDTVSLYLNKRCILKKFCVGKKKKVIKVKVQPGSSYYLTLYAHNLGRIPPNTAAIMVGGGQEDEQYITLRSDLDKSSAVKLVIEKVGG